MKADLAVLRSQEIQWREEVQRLGKELEQVATCMHGTYIMSCVGYLRTLHTVVTHTCIYVYQFLHVSLSQAQSMAAVREQELNEETETLRV